MNRDELPELHYVTDIRNVGSILQLGILSHRRAAKYNHVSVAMEEVQSRRAVRIIPGGQPIHNYACLYLHARNPMLSALRAKHSDLIVLRVDPRVLDIPNAIIADGNASSDYTRFYPSPSGLQNLQSDLVLARYWTSPDPYEYMNKKRSRCAELLIPNRIVSDLIIGAYVSCKAAEERTRGTGFSLPIGVDPDFFFGAGA